MPEEYTDAPLPINESLTDSDYLRIRELGGQAIGEILDKAPYFQVESLCDIARREHELHGDEEFIKKNLDLAFDRASTVGAGVFIMYGGPESRTQSAYGYLKVAEASLETGQDENYVLAAIDAATQEIERKNLGWPVVKAVADVAHSIEPNSQRVYNIMSLSIDPSWMKGGIPYKSRVYGLDDILEYATLCGLDDKNASALVNEARQKNSAIEDPAKRAKNAAALLVSLKQHSERPNVNGEVFQAHILEVLEEARADTLSIEGAAERVEVLGELARAADAALSDRYSKDLLRQGLAVAISDSEQEPSTTIGQIHDLIAVSIKLEQQADNDQLFAQPGIDFIQSLDVSAREKHQLLNQLLGRWIVPEDFLAANNIEKKPLSFVFKP